MTNPATPPTTATLTEDPRDRRRRRTALFCATLSSGIICFLLGALTHSWEYVYESGIFWIGAISVASIAALWALITSSTKDAVGQLVETIIARYRAIVAESRTWLAQVVREALREEVKEQLTDPGTAIAGELGRIRDRVYMRPDDDSSKAVTVPIRYEQPERPIQHVIGVAPAGNVYGPRGDMTLDRLADRLLARVDERIDARLEDVQTLARNEPSVNGKVVGMPLNRRP